MEKIIHMPSIAFYLRKRGFPILRTDINIKKKKYEVYYTHILDAFVNYGDSSHVTAD